MIESKHEAVEIRVQSVVLKSLGMAANSSLPLRMGSTPGWDSMGHMSIVMALEHEFKVTFPAYRLPELVDLPSITRAVTDMNPK